MYCGWRRVYCPPVSVRRRGPMATSILPPVPFIRIASTESTMQQNIVFSEKALELQAIAKEIAEKHVRPNAAKFDKI